jgi:hypothetical protein
MPDYLYTAFGAHINKILEAKEDGRVFKKDDFWAAWPAANGGDCS